MLIASFTFTSRNVWLASLVSVSVFIYLKTYRQISIFKLILTCFFLIAAIIFVEQVWKMLFSAYDAAVDIRRGTVDLRFDMYKEGLRQFLQSPFLGVGHGAFSYAVPVGPQGELTKQIAMHNTYLAFLLNGGLGGIAFILLLAKMLSMLFNKYKRSPIIHILFSGYIGFLSASFFYPGMLSGDSISWLTLGVFAAACVHGKQLANELEPTKL
jgi:O-antigen ligase